MMSDSSGTTNSPLKSICNGRFCHLEGILDFIRDRMSENASLTVRQFPRSYIIAAREERRMNDRERAVIILRRVLTPEEFNTLEDAGSLVEFAVKDKVQENKNVCISLESFLMAEKENRAAMSLLREAEGTFSKISDNLHSSTIGSPIKTGAPEILTEIGHQQGFPSQTKEVPVCGVCFAVYNILDKARQFIAPKDKSKAGRLDDIDDVFENLDNDVDFAESKNKRTTAEALPKAGAVSQIRSCLKKRGHGGSSDENSNAIGAGKRVVRVVCDAANRKNEKCPALVVKTLAFTGADGKMEALKELPRPSIENGTLKFSDTISFPFAVMSGGGLKSSNAVSNKRTKLCICNLVICHDVFETLEKMRIIFQSITSEYPSVRILIWNYPGQAFTEFGDHDLLNNELHAACLNKLLDHLNEKEIFDRESPFYFFAQGNGSMIAFNYCSTYDIASLKGVLVVNGMSHVDSHYASVLHDCRNAFKCSPGDYQDLPAYFYSKYLFSGRYLKEVTAPLALNLYCAIHNPIDRRGRIALCEGALKHADMRPCLSNLWKPLVAIYGNESICVTPSQTFNMAKIIGTGRQCSSIQECLKKSGICSIRVEGGHELLQEKKNLILGIVEQLLTGFHDRGIPTLNSRSKESKVGNSNIKIQLAGNQFLGIINDGFVEKPLCLSEPLGLDVADPHWEHFKKEKIQALTSSQTSRRKKKLDYKFGFTDRSYTHQLSLDPTMATFDKNTPHSSDLISKYPEVKEYMNWRLKRNQTRLIKLDKACLQIQCAARIMLARCVLMDLKVHASATLLQQTARVFLARLELKQKQKDLAAIKLTQRALRAYLARSKAYRHRKKIEFQIIIARRFRGMTARQQVVALSRRIRKGATKIQSSFRCYKAKEVLKRLWINNFSSIVIQKVVRGHSGRKRASTERQKFLFSRLQKADIEYGRQMLQSHKEKATSIQSDLAKLLDEKKKFQSQLDVLMSELAQIDEHVCKLQNEMHQLTRMGEANLQSSAREEARETRSRLDREYCLMIKKISSRNDELNQLQAGMKRIHIEEEGKKDQLRGLERELVNLLRAQQNEIDAIRSRHFEESHSRNLISDLKTWDSCLLQNQSVIPNNSLLLEAARKKEAAQLMKSAESMMKFGFMNSYMTHMSQMSVLKAMNQLSNNSSDFDLTTSMAPISGLIPDTVKPVPNNCAGASAKKAFNIDWTVDDVLAWLSDLQLSQYHDEFRDGAVDGLMLLSLTDDDLLNTMGIEHKLHRKKIIIAADKFRSLMPSPVHAQLDDLQGNSTHQPIVNSSMYNDERGRGALSKPENMPKHSVNPGGQSVANTTFTSEEIFAWVRHQKFEPLQKALESIASKKFDPLDVRVQFAENYGTSYHDVIEREPFHMNKTNSEGNTLLHIAAQNGNLNIGKLLIHKGCNPNHQNNRGRTAAHFAFAYNYVKFAGWLFSDEVGGMDTIVDVDGRDAYEGIESD